MTKENNHPGRSEPSQSNRKSNDEVFEKQPKIAFKNLKQLKIALKNLKQLINENNFFWLKSDMKFYKHNKHRISY